MTRDGRIALGADGLRVTSAGSVVLRRPIPRNVGITIVMACEPHERFDAIRELEPAMAPRRWLEMAMRCAADLHDSPMPILEGLRRAFPLYRSNDFLSGEVSTWWAYAEHPLTIWRGCYEGINEAGVCYSRDPLTARRYVRPGGCGRARALLVEATVEDGDYIAHKRDRGELELWALPERPTVVARHVLPLPDEFFSERTEPLSRVRRPFAPDETDDDA